MASIPSSPPVHYVSPELGNLSMLSPHESSLSWQKEELEELDTYGIFMINPDREKVGTQVDVPNIMARLHPRGISRSIKASELALMCLQKLYECDLSLTIVPSMICINFLRSTHVSEKHTNFDGNINDSLGNTREIELSQRSDNQAEQDVFGLQFENVRTAVQLADQLLISLLKKAERPISIFEFSDITTRLKFWAEKAAKTTSAQAPNIELGRKKADIIDRINFLSYSLTFFQKHLLPDGDHHGDHIHVSAPAHAPDEGHIHSPAPAHTIVSIIKETGLSTVVIDMIADYLSFKIINPTTSTSLSSSHADKSNSHQLTYKFSGIINPEMHAINAEAHATNPETHAINVETHAINPGTHAGNRKKTGISKFCICS